MSSDSMASPLVTALQIHRRIFSMKLAVTVQSAVMALVVEVVPIWVPPTVARHHVEGAMHCFCSQDDNGLLDSSRCGIIFSPVNSGVY